MVKKKLGRIPKKPGVYFFKDRAGKIIYIGKAAVLRARVGQYFRKASDESPKTGRLRNEIADVGWKVCGSELDALIEEARLIKRHLPRFNIIFRDDKNYAYACISNEKPYPRIFKTHQPQQQMRCIGPFTGVGALKEVLRMLRAIYPFCTLRPSHYKRPCFDTHLGRCTGVCADPSKTAETKRNIYTIAHILSGKRQSILTKLKVAMKKASQREDFKKASEFKRQIEKLDDVFSHHFLLMREEEKRREAFSQEWPEVERVLKKLLRTARPIRKVEGYDISNISGKYAVGSMVVFENGTADKNQYRKFKIRYSGEEPNDPKMMAEVLTRRLKHPEWPLPDLMLLDGGRGQLSVVGRVLSKNQFVIALAKEKEEIYVPHAFHPISAASLGKPFLFFVQRVRDEAHRFAVTYHRKLRGRM